MSGLVLLPGVGSVRATHRTARMVVRRDVATTVLDLTVAEALELVSGIAEVGAANEDGVRLVIEANPTYPREVFDE